MQPLKSDKFRFSDFGSHSDFFSRRSAAKTTDFGLRISHHPSVAEIHLPIPTGPTYPRTNVETPMSRPKISDPIHPPLHFDVSRPAARKDSAAARIRHFPVGALCRLVALLVLTVSLCSRAQNWIQWPRSEGGNGHYFALTTCATNWDAGQQLAVSWGGHLATITSSQEQNFINRTFLVGNFEHLPLWIGLVDRALPGTFRYKLRMILGSTNRFEWVTGEPLSYTFWKPGEPNNSPPGEYYVTVNWEYSDNPPRGLKGDWNDTPLNGTAKYGGSTSGPYFGIVERDTDPSRPPRGRFAIYALLIGLGALLILFLAFLRLLRSRRRT